MTEIKTTEGLQLSPMEWRVYAALHQWCDHRALARAVNMPNGRQCYTPPKIVLTKLRKKLKPFGLEIICMGKRGALSYCVRAIAPDRVALVQSEGADKPRVARL